MEPIPGPHLPVLARSQFADDQPPELSVPFGKFDPGWLEIFAELAETMARRLTFDLPDAPPAVFDLPEDARVVLVGDWGTGGPDAEAVAARIADALDEAAARQCHLIHLGDIYYAGTRWESKRRFLDKWPIHSNPPPDHHSWTLNGNHDMYSAAEGLFQTVLPDPRFAHQRTIDHAPTTQFHLQTKRWQILGLDSSFRFDPQDPAGLHGSQGDRQRRWLTNCCSD